jgi:hypothetical protein
MADAPCHPKLVEGPLQSCIKVAVLQLRFDCEPNSDDANDDDRLFGHSYENICRTCPAESRSINSTRYHPSQSRREYTLYGKE